MTSHCRRCGTGTLVRDWAARALTPPTPCAPPARPDLIVDRVGERLLRGEGDGAGTGETVDLPCPMLVTPVQIDPPQRGAGGA